MPGALAESQFSGLYLSNGSYFTQCGYTNPDDGSCDLGTTRPTSTAAGSSTAGLGTGNDVVAFLFTLGIGLDQ